MTISDAVYSLSDTTRVNFAVGNLMYKPSTDTWKLADHQYDFVGGYKKDKFDGEDLVQGQHYGTVYDTIDGVYGPCQNTGGSRRNIENPNYDGWIDLFPQEAAKNIHFVDTVHNFIYRTPKHVEFQYLVGGFKIGGYTIGRKDYEKLRARGRIVLEDGTFINGLILLPDMPDSCSSVEQCVLKIMPTGTSFKSDYDGCWYYEDNIFTAAQWDVLEKQGAVFLPAGGGASWKSGTTYDYGMRYNRSGFYWTWNTSKSLEFGGYYYRGQNNTPSFVDNCNENNRRSIRVVREERQTSTQVATRPKSCRDYKWGTGLIETDGGRIRIDSIDECTYGLKALPKNGYKFAYFKDLGSISFEDSVVLEIDTTTQNYVYEATFVKDNAFIYKWLDDSIIIRTDTTDLLSGCDDPGWSYTLIKDSIRMTEEDERITKLDWGVWKSDVNEVINRNEYAGLPLHMIIHNSCDKPVAVIDTIIPVVVHDTMHAHTMVFPDIPHTDLQVLEGAVLYVDSDIVVNGILDIHEGGKVVINEGKILETQGIILRGDGMTKKWAQLNIKGEVINNSGDLIYYDYTLDDKEYYPLSLPDTVMQSVIVSSITGSSTTYTSYLYNTAVRNTHETGWEVSGQDYILGKGYILWSDPNLWRGSREQNTNIIRYPIRVDLSNEKDNKQVGIYCDQDESISESDRNWNLIGNPYLSDYRIDRHGGVVIYPVEVDGTRTYMYDLVEYITYSIDGYRTYEQDMLDGFIMKPFNSYFVQLHEGTDIIFDRDYLVAMGTYSPRRDRSRSGLRTGITLSQGDREEHIGLVYGDYTDEYEINADLAKMFGNASAMYAYSLSKGVALAFQAVSIDSIYPIPLGYKNAKISPMTFAFDSARYVNDGLYAIWLYDSKLNTHTNLLHEEYVFMPGSPSEDNRFYITIEFDVLTDINTENELNKELIFDILGRRVSSIYHNGVYIVHKNRECVKVIR